MSYVKRVFSPPIGFFEPERCPQQKYGAKIDGYRWLALLVLAPPDGKEENHECADFTCATDPTVPLWAEANPAEHK